MTIDEVNKALAEIAAKKAEKTKELSVAQQAKNDFVEKIVIEKFGLKKAEDLATTIVSAENQLNNTGEMDYDEKNKKVKIDNKEFLLDELKEAAKQLAQLNENLAKIQAVLDEIKTREEELKKELQRLKQGGSPAPQPSAPPRPKTPTPEKPATGGKKPLVEIPKELHDKIKAMLPGYDVNGDRNNLIIQNDKLTPPQGFQVSKNTIQPMYNNPLTEESSTKMIELARELYGNELVLFAASKEDQAVMKAAADKLGVKYELVTTKEDFDKKIVELQQKKDEPKADATKSAAPTPDAADPNKGATPKDADPNASKAVDKEKDASAKKEIKGRPRANAVSGDEHRPKPEDLKPPEGTSNSFHP